VEAFISDDPGSATASASATPARAAIAGSIVSNTNVEISTDGTTWVTLGSPNGITIKLQSATDSSTVHGEVDAAAGSYSHVRVTLREAEANLLAGSVIGAVALASNASLAIGGNDRVVVLQRQVTPFEVVAGSLTTIFLELNSESWITASNVQDLVVEDAEVAAAVATRVSVRVDQ
jgi:hypothetical protein